MMIKLRKALADPKIVALFIFSACFFLYACIGIFLIARTWMIDNGTIDFDIYFSFDNPNYFNAFFNIYKEGMNEIKHPWLKMLLMPLILVLKAMEVLGGQKAKALALLVVLDCLVSASMVLVYKYLDEIVQLKGNARKLLLVMSYALFANSIIISFTPESYPFSLFLLTLLVYMYSKVIKTGSKLPLLNVSILSVFITGITVSNVVKCLIPLSVLKLKLRDKLRAAAGITAALFCTMLLYFAGVRVYSCYTEYRYGDAVRYDLNVVRRTMADFSRYNKRNGDEKAPINSVFIVPWPRAAVTYFFGSPIMLAPLTNVPLRVKKSQHPQLNVVPYDHYSQYAIILTLLGIIVLSTVLHYRNRLVLLLALLFASDVILHVFLRWGIYESMIYGSHWIFIVPMLIGWLYQAIDDRSKKSLDALLILIMALVIMNNVRGIYALIGYALKNYPV